MLKNKNSALIEVKEVLNKYCYKPMSSRISKRIKSVAIFSAAAIITTGIVFTTNFRVGYAVKVDDQVLGVVPTKSEYYEVLNEVKTEVETINPGTTEQEFTRYKTYIKDKKLYAKKLNNNEEKIIFENEEVENITIMPICCAGNGNLLILTTNGNVYISKKDCNYQFNFDFPFEKLESKDIISLEIVENYDDFSITLYGKNTKGEQIKLYEVK